MSDRPSKAPPRPQQPQAAAHGRHPFDDLADVRDGLTRVERVILYELHKAQQEFGDRYVPTGLLYGRVVEHVNIAPQEFQRLLARLGGMRLP
jgi:hypothetical protein